MEGVKLCGLWKNKTKEGKPYLSGKLGSAKLLIFQNERKQAANHPDYTVFLVPGENKPKDSSGQQTNNGAPPDEDGYDPLGRDIPF
ncbi:MAG: hypothetical protein JXA73_00220 [Acidobacteria bacterium]|nr:hypothetical protein [Acidobacteriota bacterium]